MSRTWGCSEGIVRQNQPKCKVDNGGDETTGQGDYAQDRRVAIRWIHVCRGERSGKPRAEMMSRYVM